MALFDEVVCYSCKEPFGIERATRQVLLRTHQSFFCPHGHSQAYLEGDSEATKLRRERDRLKQENARLEDAQRMMSATAARYRDEAEHERRRANGYKGHAAKITKRAKAGVCPCCNRTFIQLARHMASQHPQFTPEAPEPLRVVGGTGA